MGSACQEVRVQLGRTCGQDGDVLPESVDFSSTPVQRLRMDREHCHAKQGESTPRTTATHVALAKTLISSIGFVLDRASDGQSSLVLTHGGSCALTHSFSFICVAWHAQPLGVYWTGPLVCKRWALFWVCTSDAFYSSTALARLLADRQ